MFNKRNNQQMLINLKSQAEKLAEHVTAYIALLNSENEFDANIFIAAFGDVVTGFKNIREFIETFSKSSSLPHPDFQKNYQLVICQYRQFIEANNLLPSIISKKILSGTLSEEDQSSMLNFTIFENQSYLHISHIIQESQKILAGRDDPTKVYELKESKESKKTVPDPLAPLSNEDIVDRIATGIVTLKHKVIDSKLKNLSASMIEDYIDLLNPLSNRIHHTVSLLRKPNPEITEEKIGEEVKSGNKLLEKLREALQSNAEIPDKAMQSLSVQEKAWVKCLLKQFSKFLLAHFEMKFKFFSEEVEKHKNRQKFKKANPLATKGREFTPFNERSLRMINKGYELLAEVFYDTDYDNEPSYQQCKGKKR